MFEIVMGIDDFLIQLVKYCVKPTVYFPALLYVCTGFLAVEYIPSPKLYFHEVGDPVLLSVNCTFDGDFPEVQYFTNCSTSPTGS